MPLSSAPEDSPLPPATHEGPKRTEAAGWPPRSLHCVYCVSYQVLLAEQAPLPAGAQPNVFVPLTLVSENVSVSVGEIAEIV